MTLDNLRTAAAEQGYRLAVECRTCGRPLTAHSSMSKHIGPQCLKKNPAHVSDLAGLDVNGDSKSPSLINQSARTILMNFNPESTTPQPNGEPIDPLDAPINFTLTGAGIQAARNISFTIDGHETVLKTSNLTNTTVQPPAAAPTPPFEIPKGFKYLASENIAHGHLENINDGRILIFIKYTPGTSYRVAFMSKPNAFLSVAEMHQAIKVSARLQHTATALCANEVQA